MITTTMMKIMMKDDTYDKSDDDHANTIGWLGTLICVRLIAASTTGPIKSRSGVGPSEKRETRPSEKAAICPTVR